jgi:hypothetical protein
MNSIDQSQSRVTFGMLKNSDRYKDLDASKPILVLLPFDSKKHRQAILLQTEAVTTNNLIQALEELRENEVKNFQAVYRLADGSDASTGDYALEHDKVGGEPDASFIGKTQIWADRATQNPTSAAQFWNAVPIKPQALGL